MKTFKRILTAIVATVLFSAAFSSFGCGKASGEMHYGLCASPSEIYGSVTETCYTEDYIADVQQAMGSDSARVNFRFSIVFNQSVSSDEITFNARTVAKLHSFVDKLVERGVTRIVALTDCYLYPYDYGHSINTCVPDPLLETRFYERWLAINKTAWGMIAKEFPEIHYFEPTNEPDHTNGGSLNKNGYSYSGGKNNDNYIWSYDDAGYIIADMCYYTREAVREVNPENKVLTPGLCAFTISFDYLEAIYAAIKSETLPTGKDYSVTDADEYFDILNWHPYILSQGCQSVKEWSDFQREFYSIAEKNGDKGKPVWFTELGFTDKGLGEAAERENAENLVIIIEKSKELGFVDTIIVYCISDLYDTPVSDTEDHFGMIRSLADPDRGGEIKPIGEAFFYAVNGQDADISVLRDTVERHYKLFNGLA